MRFAEFLRVSFGGVLCVPILDEQDVKQKEIIEKSIPFVENFAKKLLENFHNLPRKTRIIFKISPGAGYLPEHLHVYLAKEEAATTGIDEITFWGNQFSYCIIEEAFFDLQEEKDGHDKLAKVVKRFNRALEIRKVYDEAMKMLEAE